MRIDNNQTIIRLQGDLPIKRPEAWLTAHKADVMNLLDIRTGLPIGEVAASLGLTTGTIQKWRRKAEAKPSLVAGQEMSLESDAAFWHGMAMGLIRAMELQHGARA